MSFYALIDEHHLPNHRRLLQYLLVNLRCGVFCECPVSFCSISQTCVITELTRTSHILLMPNLVCLLSVYLSLSFLRQLFKLYSL